MTTITAAKAQANLFKLLDEVSDSHEPIQISGKRANAVLLSAEEWRAIQETLHLLANPGMRQSIREGLMTPIKDCSEELEWGKGKQFVLNQKSEGQR